ncbi:glycosyltransferase family 2 protein [Romboutsia weinsteinii]|uniref:Glycosyltransferase family 2 protein n=1 Tax=Romboutsia weinsteinii TaxID=2020949 RepID=A0A371IY62_9FIRM|nr:glycosyltransferase family 2 protein [Romboutsia weinsteinii]RDY25404.1 glycosyltransferase family 2 protein [Romboutsia weinsteinii]
MVSISLCMIVKDEEKTIARCLDSINSVIDEIIIVDTGSTDKTKEIASNYTEKIYDFEWKDDFSVARNFSFSKSTKDYILWMDADEIINLENKNKLIKLKENLNSEIDCISFQTYVSVDESNNPKCICRRNRLVKREKNFKWVGFIHEYIKVDGSICDSDVYIIHNKIKNNENRNLDIYKSNIAKGNQFTDRDLYYYGKELYCNKMWEECIKTLEEFIKRDPFIEEKVDALCKIGRAYINKGQSCIGREYLYKTFEYDEPRGEIIFSIADSFEKERKYKQAIVWYEIILGLELPNDCNQCVNVCCLRFTPHLNLCICYYEINDIAKSYYHHLKCKDMNPLNECVIKNDEFFKSIIKKVD